MRSIIYIVQKEFLQVFRNKSLLPLIFVMPVIQLLILSNAATYEVRNIALHVIDHDLSQTSRRLVGKFEASPYFEIVNTSFSQKEAEHDLIKDKADLILEIPPRFEHDLEKNSAAGLHLNLNAINSAKAGIALNYSNAIIQDFNAHIRAEMLPLPPEMAPPSVDISYANWFNPDLNFKTFMVPGILVLLVTMIGLFLGGMNIVREREIGTIEQLNVTPIKKYQFIIGKLLPFWIIAMFELAFGLGIGLLLFKIPFVGNPVIIFAFAGLYLTVILGIGLLISTFTETQQQAMFLSWFFMVIFILMSGLFTPIESMPTWAQKITWFNPIAYFVEVIRMVILKGSSWGDVAHHFGALTIFSLALNGLAVWNYRKRS
ncbi:MAG: ABC transporter permease [Bacteroidia bacterium]|nr:ABC transporter permease [Bacteroidia bacterium]